MDVSDQVIKVLNELSKKIGISIDWTQQNILPQIKDFMHRYVLYETYTSIMWLVIGSLLLGVGLFLLYKFYKYFKNDDISIATLFFIVGIIMTIVGVIVDISQIEDIIKINTVPEVYFINYIQNLIQNK